VVQAADDAGGQGFVTELAGDTSTLKSMIWTPNDEQNWSSFQGRVYMSFAEFFDQAYNLYGGWDGFWDATRASVTLPATLAYEDFKLCPSCYAGQIEFKPATYVAELKRSVIDPVKVVQNLIDAHPKLTRMYTTLSAEEMTVDPVFTFNADLGDIDNQHTAERIIECNPDIFQFEAPWRIELPQGVVVRGNAATVGTWPTELDGLPSNARIVRTSASGTGKVVEDNMGPIGDQLADYNASIIPTTPSSNSGGTNGSSTSSGGGGCNIAAAGSSWQLALGALALSSLLRRRRKA
jgi:hypothetical protein